MYIIFPAGSAESHNEFYYTTSIDANACKLDCKLLFFSIQEHSAPGVVHFVYTQKFENILTCRIIILIESDQGSETRVLVIYSTLRDRSQTLVRGAWWKKYRKNFQPPPPTSRNFRAPFLPWKLWVNPIEKYVKSIFTGMFVVIFSRLSLQGRKFKGPPFCIRFPLTSVCELSLI